MAVIMVKGGFNSLVGILYRYTNCAFNRLHPSVCKSINACALLPLILTNTLFVSISVLTSGVFTFFWLVLGSTLSLILCAAVLIGFLDFLILQSIYLCPGFRHHKHFLSLISCIFSAAVLLLFTNFQSASLLCWLGPFGNGLGLFDGGGRFNLGFSHLV